MWFVICPKLINTPTTIAKQLCKTHCNTTCKHAFAWVWVRVYVFTLCFTKFANHITVATKSWLYISYLVVHGLPLLEAVLQGRLPEEPRGRDAIIIELVHTEEVGQHVGDLHGELAAVLGDARWLAHDHLLDHVLDSLQLALHTLGLHLQELAGLQGADAFEDLLVGRLGEHRAGLGHEVQDMLQDPLLALGSHLLDEEVHLVVEGLVQGQQEALLDLDQLGHGTRAVHIPIVKKGIECLPCRHHALDDGGIHITKDRLRLLHQELLGPDLLQLLAVDALLLWCARVLVHCHYQDNMCVVGWLPHPSTKDVWLVCGVLVG